MNTRKSLTPSRFCQRRSARRNCAASWPAYNNLADPGTAEGRAQLRRALDLLRPYEETLKDDHCWNFRMAYAYYYLDQEGPALPYF